MSLLEVEFSVTDGMLVDNYEAKTAWRDICHSLTIWLQEKVESVTMYKEDGVYKGSFIIETKNEDKLEENLKEGIKYLEIRRVRKVEARKLFLPNDERILNVISLGLKLETIIQNPFGACLQVEVIPHVHQEFVVLEILCGFRVIENDKLAALSSVVLNYNGITYKPLDYKEMNIFEHTRNKDLESQKKYLLFQLDSKIEFSKVAVEFRYFFRKIEDYAGEIDYYARIFLSQDKPSDPDRLIATMGRSNTPFICELFDMKTSNLSYPLQVSKKTFWKETEESKRPTNIMELLGYDYGKLNPQDVHKFLEGVEEGNLIEESNPCKQNKCSHVIMELNSRDYYIPKQPSWWDYISWIYPFKTQRDLIDKKKCIEFTTLHLGVIESMSKIMGKNTQEATIRIYVVITNIDMIPAEERSYFKNRLMVELIIRGVAKNYIYYVQRECEWNQDKLRSIENARKQGQLDEKSEMLSFASVKCIKKGCTHNFTKTTIEGFEVPLKRFTTRPIRFLSNL